MARGGRCEDIQERVTKTTKMYTFTKVNDSAMTYEEGIKRIKCLKFLGCASNSNEDLWLWMDKSEKEITQRHGWLKMLEIVKRRIFTL